MSLTIYCALMRESIETFYKTNIQAHYHAVSRTSTGPWSPRDDIKSALIELILDYGHFLYKNDLYKQAQKQYDQALRLDPDNIIAITQLGMCLTKLSNYIDARRTFEGIFKRTTFIREHAYAFLNIACTYRFQNNFNKAALYLREAKNILPDDQDILQEEMNLRLIVAQQYMTSKLFSDQNKKELLSIWDDHKLSL